MNNKYDVEQFYNKLSKALSEGEAQRVFPSRFYDAYFKGNRTLYQIEQSEFKKFDVMWIKTVESYFPSINRITINVKSTLRYQSEIIPIEKTKKINKESVIDLMMHSNQIREISEEGGVVPKAIRASLSEIEYGIYENRFVMTLINRLRDFIGKRLKIMRDGIKGTKTVKLNVTGNFSFENSDVEMQLDIKQKETAENKKTDEFNQMVLEKAEKLYKLVTRLTSSQFMSYMKRYKPVKPPILKTQIILKNPDFKNAYLLWLFLDKCNDLGYESNTETVKKRFTPEYTKNINQAMLIAYSAMLTNLKAKLGSSDKKDAVTYKETKAVTLNRLPEDFEIVTHPLSYEVEDTALNEFYINKAKQLFKGQLAKYAEEDKSEPYKVSVKKALADMLAINKSVYESFFAVNADDDVFTRLVKDDDPQSMLEEAYQKYYVAQTVREVKEKDLYETLELEKKWQKELKKRYAELIRSTREQSDEKTEKELAAERQEVEKLLAASSADIAQQKKQLLREHKKEMTEYEKKLKDELRSEKKKIEADAKAALVKEKEKLQKQAQKIKAAEDLRFAKQKEKLKAQQLKEKEKKKAALEAQKKALKEKEKKKLLEYTAQQKKKNEQAVQSSIEKLKAKENSLKQSKTVPSNAKGGNMEALNLAVTAMVDNAAQNNYIKNALNSTDFK
jgi:hypothetical protein